MASDAERGTKKQVPSAAASAGASAVQLSDRSAAARERKRPHGAQNTDKKHGRGRVSHVVGNADGRHITTCALPRGIPDLHRSPSRSLLLQPGHPAVRRRLITCLSHDTMLDSLGQVKRASPQSHAAIPTLGPPLAAVHVQSTLRDVMSPIHCCNSLIARIPVWTGGSRPCTHLSLLHQASTT